jgi:hypothetical protein
MSSPEPQVSGERLLRIVGGLIDHTRTKAIIWERGAPPDSWAVTVALSRFRVRTESGSGQPPYVLEVFGEGESLILRTGTSQQWDDALARLYSVAHQSAMESKADPLRQVEEQLGL